MMKNGLAPLPQKKILRTPLALTHATLRCVIQVGRNSVAEHRFPEISVTGISKPTSGKNIGLSVLDTGILPEAYFCQESACSLRTLKIDTGIPVWNTGILREVCFYQKLKYGEFL